MVALGGLHILGTERHESRRIDNQLRGRAGRQGDPGSSRFYLSLQDDLLRIFGGERMQNLMLRLGMEEDVPIESKLITKRIAAAQKAVEVQNFEVPQTSARVRRRHEQAAPGRLRHAPPASRRRRSERARHGNGARRARHFHRYSLPPGRCIPIPGTSVACATICSASSATRSTLTELAGMQREAMEEVIFEQLAQKYQAQRRPDRRRPDAPERAMGHAQGHRRPVEGPSALDRQPQGRALACAATARKIRSSSTRKNPSTLFQDMMDRIEDETVRLLFFLQIAREPGEGGRPAASLRR